MITIAALAVLDATAPKHFDHRVVIRNTTKHDLVEFHASAIYQRSWLGDMLADQTVTAGKNVQLNIDDGSGRCLYDFEAVFDNGGTVISRVVNVCEISKFTYY